MIRATVHTPYYDWDGRKYIEFLIDDVVTRVKIPWRYGRVMCRVEGLKTVQELDKGDPVQITLHKKMWDGIEYLVLEYIRHDL
jgi:hypothetical protein